VVSASSSSSGNEWRVNELLELQRGDLGRVLDDVLVILIGHPVVVLLLEAAVRVVQDVHCARSGHDHIVLRGRSGVLGLIVGFAKARQYRIVLREGVRFRVV